MTDPTDPTDPTRPPAPPDASRPPAPPDPTRPPDQHADLGTGTSAIRGSGAQNDGDGAGEGTQTEGNSIVAASWIGSVVFAATTALGTAATQLDIAALVVALAMFAAGTVVFFVAFAGAVTRSRTDEIGVMNLFFLDRSAPRPVRRSLLGSLGVEIVTAVAAAAIRPNTSLAFGTLAPVYALSLMGLYGARHGVFPPRLEKAPKR